MKIKLIDEERKEIGQVSVDQDILADESIICYKGEYFIFSSVPSSNFFSVAVFQRVKAPLHIEAYL